MKKFLFILSAGAICLLSSCRNKKDEGSKKEENGMSETARKNLESMKIVTTAFETGDVSMIDSAVSADFVDHTERGDLNRDSLKSMIKMMHSGKSTFKFNTVKQLADDEYAMSWYEITGTSDGSMMPPGPIKMNSVDVVRFKDGKGVEHWSFAEYREMAKAMQDMMKNMPKETPK
ncbi:MAG: SnoaL-like domain-containing protein [Chitinophagaceae bacterium]|nr:SnoaL-like domain-containing protein [Chitinophagaceae bacterium]